MQGAAGVDKTRTASEWVVARVKQGKAKRIALVARTAADCRDVLIEGQSGILSVARRLGIEATYERSKRRVSFPEYDAIATAFSAEEPDQLRGSEFDTAAADELASWDNRDPLNSAWANLLMCMRIGEPQVIAITTPRPTSLIKELVNDPNVIVTRGATRDNASNLAPAFLEEVQRRYGGTRLSLQELEGQILDDTLGALWTYDLIANNRVEEAPPLKRIVVGLDPAVTVNETSDYTGITVAGIGIDGEYYVLHSEQVKLTPQGWATRALALLDEYDGEYIIAERNNGGLMVESTIRNVRARAPVKTIHASAKKAARATPIATLYEQNKVHHVGELKDLESQMSLFPVAADHDDMVDSLVYALIELDPYTNKAGTLLTFR